MIAAAPASGTREALARLSSSVVSAKAARPSGPGSATDGAADGEGEGDEGDPQRILWRETDPETGETRYYDPAERYKHRFGPRPPWAKGSADSS